jgi:trehalose synthase
LSLLASYADVVGEHVIQHLHHLAEALEGRRIVHVNSTRVGGGVAEILAKMVPLTRELGLEASWEVIRAGERFYQCTKSFHNALQGDPIDVPAELLREYQETNRWNAGELGPRLVEADFVVVHDPQPAPLLSHLSQRKGKWVWRWHIDANRPYPPVWSYLRDCVVGYDAAIFSLPEFAQSLPQTQYVIAPSIDPLSDKNRELEPAQVNRVLERFELDPERQLIVQVSRFDRFKDPVGVIRAFRLARRYHPGLQLALAGGGATDDPEGEEILAEVRAAADDDPDIKILLLPPDAHETINALQRGADIVVQKSTKEGFGLTVAEAMWKEKPVVGGDVGGIRLQVVDGQTGFRVGTAEGAALRIHHLLERPQLRAEMGHKARAHVRENFLLTRHLRDYLMLMLALLEGGGERIQVGGRP